jgi:prepilin-type N-terminal cleavage/methylation domain-containing protein
VKTEFQITNSEFRTGERRSAASFFIRRAFTLVEVMMVMALLSLIVIALMGVFSSTQAAFRASVTQTDVLESGRAAMDLISGDLRAMTPSLGATNVFGSANNSVQLANNGQIPVNFYLYFNNPATPPLVQSLVASTQQRTNLVESFFVLSRNNQTWSGVGYVVDTLSTNGISPLYRFVPTDLPVRPTPMQLFTNFLASSALPVSQYNTNMHRLMDGVLGFRVRALDPNGVWLTNGYSFGFSNTLKNAAFFTPFYGEVGCYMFSNALPASVEIEMATLEDRALQRASTWPNNSAGQSNYLAQQAGRVHIFRQRVAVPNVDPAAYR